MDSINDIVIVDEMLERFSRKETLSNSYILKEEYQGHIAIGNLYFEIDGQNLFFYLKKNGFYRVYYFINQFEKKHSSKCNLPLVLEIVYRGDKDLPYSHIEYWENSGFEKHLSRDCFFLKMQNSESLFNYAELQVKKGKKHEEIYFAKHLIDNNLDLYTGDSLSIEELSQFAERDLLYVCYFNGELCGMLQADKKKGVFWLGHIVVDERFRGKNVAKALLEYYLSEGINLQCKQFQLWVIKENSVAINLYSRYGFKYFNKSTYSMLKIK